MGAVKRVQGTRQEMNAVLTEAGHGWRTLAKWIAGLALLVAVGVSSYSLGRSHVSTLESEAVLRRALALVAFQQTDAEVSVVAPLPLSGAQVRELQGPCSLSLRNTYPYDASSYFSFFFRPAVVWRVACGTAANLEVEVRRGDTTWTVILRPI